MNEHFLQLIASSKLVWLAVFSYMYGEGGIANKWLRRFLGASWMMLGIFIYSKIAGTWNICYLLFLPLAIGALTNGYSGQTVFKKILRRGLYGFLISLCALPIVVFSHLYILFAYSIGLAVLSSILLGVWNPCKSARDEESLVASLCFIFTLFLI